MACGGETPSEDSRRWFECQICLSSMVGRIPRALSCLHTFCEPCLENLPLVASGITCPTCRRHTELQPNKASSLPLNFMIDQLATKLHQINLCQTCVENEGASNQAAVYCNDGCGRLCSDCRKRHDSVESFKEHQVEPLRKKDEKSNNNCVTHNKLIHLFCTKCKACLCSTCALSSKHQGHESCIKEIQAEYHKLRSNIKDRIKAIQDSCTDKLLAIQTQEENVKRTGQEIENEYKRRRQKLDKERAKLLEKLKQISAPLTDYRLQIETLREGSKLIKERIEMEGLEKCAQQKMLEILVDEEKCETFQREASGLKTLQVSQHRFAASSCNTELGGLVRPHVRVGCRVRIRNDAPLAFSERVLHLFYSIGYVRGVHLSVLHQGEMSIICVTYLITAYLYLFFTLARYISVHQRISTSIYHLA